MVIMSDSDYTFEFLSISKDFVKTFDFNYKLQKDKIVKEVIHIIEEKYNLKINKKK